MVNQYICQDIMSRDVIKLHEDDDIHQALDKFKQVNLMSSTCSKCRKPFGRNFSVI